MADECLHTLQRKQFVQRARRSSVADESEYAFRHVLVRDVAYTQIPRARRADKHQRAAAWIESLGRPDDHAEMLAHHHVSALELAGTDRSSDELTAQAVISLIRAGERASAVNAFPSAAAYYERVLQLLPDKDSRRLAVVFAHARALFSSGDERFGLEEAQAQALISVGMARYSSGDDEGRDDIERGIELALASNHFAAAARGYQNLSVAADEGVRQLELLRASEDLWLRVGDGEGARYTHANRVANSFGMGNWDEALPLIDAFIADCEAGRPHYQEALLRRCRAWARIVRDEDAEGAIDDIERSVAVARAAKDPQVLFETLGDAAFMYAEIDRLEEARTLAEEMVAANPQAPLWATTFILVADRLGMANAIRVTFARARERRGPRGEALTLAVAERRFVDAAEIAART